MKKINIKDLAKELNISVATVSKALRDSHEISEKTKFKVLEAAERLNYTPNPYASSLRKKNSKTIAVILPEVADNFFSLAINGIQAIAEKKCYHVLIYLSHDKFENEKNFVNDCTSGRVDGVLIAISSETKTAEHIQNLQDENIPVVFFDRAFEQIKAAKVITNDFECGYLSAKHLLHKGCMNPVFLSLSECLSICQKRADGFIKAIKDSGKKISTERVIIYCSKNSEQNKIQLKKLLCAKNKPDGIVASVEKLAMEVYIVCQEQNICIPSDLKVVAFSTMETAPILNPSLTTITQPAFEIGKKAAEILFKGIEKSNLAIKEQFEILPSILIERNSTALL